LETGKRLWHVIAPAGIGRLDDIAVADDEWIYLYSLDVGPWRERERGGHRISVIDVESGKTLHVWWSSQSIPAPRPGRLVEMGGEIYFFTDSEFSRIDRSDVEARRHGWADPSAPAPPGISQRM
jgi:hypothetical protein